MDDIDKAISALNNAVLNAQNILKKQELEIEKAMRCLEEIVAKSKKHDLMNMEEIYYSALDTLKELEQG